MEDKLKRFEKILSQFEEKLIQMNASRFNYSTFHQILQIIYALMLIIMFVMSNMDHQKMVTMVNDTTDVIANLKLAQNNTTELLRDEN